MSVTAMVEQLDAKYASCCHVNAMRETLLRVLYDYLDDYAVVAYLPKEDNRDAPALLSAQEFVDQIDKLGGFQGALEAGLDAAKYDLPLSMRQAWNSSHCMYWAFEYACDEFETATDEAGILASWSMRDGDDNDGR